MINLTKPKTIPKMIVTARIQSGALKYETAILPKIKPRKIQLGSSNIK